MDVRRLVGENVRQYRLAAGVSQEEVAVRMGMGRAYVSGLEVAETQPFLHVARFARTRHRSA
ncbi:helix-turn-helix domain-containing protein [Bosea sp. NPDC055594]